MRKILFILIITMNYMYGQEVENVSYHFLNPSIVDNIEDYKKAFSTADMSSFRFKEKTNVIEFQSGLKVELFSSDFLRNKELELNLDNFKRAEFVDDDYVFEISQDGRYILQRYTRTEFKSRKRNNN